MVIGRGRRREHLKDISSSHVTDVTSGQKTLLGQIWCNFRLRMRRTYFRTGHVTDVTTGHVTSGSTPSQHPLKYGLSCPHILLVYHLDHSPQRPLSL
jgi:hypothetical protein